MNLKPVVTRNLIFFFIAMKFYCFEKLLAFCSISTSDLLFLRKSQTCDVCLEINGVDVTNIFKISIPNDMAPPFKVIFVESNTLSHPRVQRFCALLERFFWDVHQLCCYGSSWWPLHLQTGLINDFLSAWGKRKSLSEQVPLLFRNAQIFGVNLSNYLLFNVQLTTPLPRCRSQLMLMLISVLFVEDLPLLESSFTSSYLFCHSKTRVRNIVLSLYSCWSLSSACDGVFPKRNKNFGFIRSSVPLAERPE